MQIRWHWETGLGSLPERCEKVHIDVERSGEWAGIRSFERLAFNAGIVRFSLCRMRLPNVFIRPTNLPNSIYGLIAAARIRQFLATFSPKSSSASKSHTPAQFYPARKLRAYIDVYKIDIRKS